MDYVFNREAQAGWIKSNCTLPIQGLYEKRSRVISVYWPETFLIQPFELVMRNSIRFIIRLFPGSCISNPLRPFTRLRLTYNPSLLKLKITHWMHAYALLTTAYSTLKSFRIDHKCSVPYKVGGHWGASSGRKIL